jgi:sarcosine oxidase subunit gamma
MPDWTQPRHYGAAGAGVILAETIIAAAWNVQGDAAHASFRDEVQRLFGVGLPVTPNTMARSTALTALWIGPRSWLLLAGGASAMADFKSKRDMLNTAGGAVFDVSASRVTWTVSGPRAATVLAKGCPLDLHPRAFAAGTCAQSLLGHVNALFVKHDDTPTFDVMVARSYARDAWHALAESALQYGCEVRPPASFR